MVQWVVGIVALAVIVGVTGLVDLANVCSDEHAGCGARVGRDLLG